MNAFWGGAAVGSVATLAWMTRLLLRTYSTTK